MNTFKKIFQPNIRVLVGFSVLLLVVYIGNTLGWIYSDPEISNIPKPFLFDFFNNLPGAGLLLMMSMLLQVPLIPIHYVLSIFFGLIIGIELPSIIYWTVIIIYLYALSAIILNGTPIFLSSRRK